MYLKKLELVGFKSFASKTVFEFERGVTAIVGPNGCGKSNISDAIRWVLGEQKAKDLRGDQMMDFIFNGTADTKPLGMAEANLTFIDDKDELGLGLVEIVVSRRLFRSGESQYFINKKQCRLRDIQEAFANTGIGTDAYSYFEQGKIDNIISSKPEDRREIFEEAAGIMKYKKDKRVALRKVEATEDNLTRLNDIIREIKRQINSINRQAGKARKYKKLLKELADIEVGMLVRKRDLHVNEHNELEEKHKAAKERINDANEFTESKEEQISGDRETLQQLETEYEKLQGRKLDLLRDIDRQNNNISLCENRIEDNKNLDVAGHREIEGMKSSISTMEGELEQGQEEFKAISEEKQECDRKLAAKDEDISSFNSTFDSHAGTLRAYSDKSLEMMRKEGQLENQIKALSDRKEENIISLEVARQERESILARQVELEEKGRLLDETQASLGTQLEGATAKLDTINHRIEERNIKQAERKHQMQTLEHQLAQADSQFNLLRGMQESYEGYYSGVKAVLKESRSENSSLNGIFGVVGDLVTVEKGYETATEIVLGNRVQNIITESGDAAERAIELLKQKNAGRATFLALDTLRDTLVPEEEVGELQKCEPGVLGPALSFLKYESKYTPVMKFLLSRTVIVRDLPSALNIARRKRYNFTLVTLEGEMITSRGAISGGSKPGGGRGILMREAQISELAVEQTHLSEEIEKMSGLEETIGAILFQLDQEQVEIAKSLRSLKETLVEKERDSVRISALRGPIDKEVSSFSSRIEQLQADIEESGHSTESINQQLHKLREERANIDMESRRVQEGLTGAEEKKAELQRQLTEFKVSSASLVERQNSAQAACTRLEQQIRERRQLIENKINEMGSSHQQVEELKKSIISTKETVSELEEEKVRVEKSIELLDEQRRETMGSVTSVEDEIKKARLSLRALQEEESAQNLKLAELSFAINGIDERLRNEYNLGPHNPLVKRLPEDSNWEEIDARIQELRRKKESIGEVNMYAIEEHERLQERYDVLIEQQNDLINAKESLLKIISKINTEARKLFRETFDKVRDEFQNRFKLLFGGGKADLLLLDERDILECGIDIIASPPGKKLQNISLLSGGEKVMTAVSLLFAIFKVKPSPFCILDEVDAPLDDSNTSRFTDTLNEFLDQSQFIIITHNKSTIAIADALYGITMEKSGISKVISVRFRERHDPRQKVMQDLIGENTEGHDIEIAPIKVLSDESGDGNEGEGDKTGSQD